MSNAIRQTQGLTPAPRIFKAAVIDFKDQNGIVPIDINGDGLPDPGIQHGYLVKRVLEGTCRGKLIQVDLFERELISCIKPGEVITPEDLAGKVFDLYQEGDTKALAVVEELERIRASNGLYTIVNLSLGNSREFNSLEDVIEKTGMREITNENIAEYRERLVDWLSSQKYPFYQSWYKAVIALERVIASGTEGFVAGMNGGENCFNILTLAKGVQAIGATDANGNITHYSPKHSLITSYEQGTYSVTEIFDDNKLLGYSVLGDGHVDIPKELTSSGIPFVNKLCGRKAKEIVSSDFSEIHANVVYLREALLGAVRQKISEMDKRFSGGAPPEGDVEKIMREYFFLLMYLKPRLEASNSKYVVFSTFDIALSSGQTCFFLDEDVSGRIIYNPDGSGRAAIGLVEGTSFATPRVGGKRLNKIIDATIL